MYAAYCLTRYLDEVCGRWNPRWGMFKGGDGGSGGLMRSRILRQRGCSLIRVFRWVRLPKLSILFADRWLVEGISNILCFILLIGRGNFRYFVFHSFDWWREFYFGVLLHWLSWRRMDRTNEPEGDRVRYRAGNVVATPSTVRIMAFMFCLLTVPFVLLLLLTFSLLLTKLFFRHRRRGNIRFDFRA